MMYKIEALQQEDQIILSFLSIALGGNVYLHSYLEECYKTNEWEFYEAYQSSGMKGNPLFSRYTAKSEEKIRQAAGIVEWCYQNQHYLLLDQILKKGYKFAYQYAQQQTQIDFEHFMRCFAKRQKGKHIKEIELINQNIVLWYLSARENKPINRTNVAWQSFQNVLFTTVNETRLEKVMFSKETIEKHRVEIDDLYEEYHIPKNFRFDSLGFFIEFLIGHRYKKIYETNPNWDTKKLEKKVFQVTPTKYIGALGGWLKTLGIHELEATEHMRFTKKDLDMMFLELVYAKKYKYICHDDQDLFFISCLYMKCLSQHFQKAKRLYLDQSKQDYYVEMKAKEARINEQEAYLLRKKTEWKRTNRRQQVEIDGLQSELREAYSKIRKLEQQIETMEEHTREVHALRDYVHSKYQEEAQMKDALSFEAMIDYIQTKRIVLFGGPLNWRQKLKEHLPNVEFIDVSEINRDISKIQRVDAVFINISVFAHSFYKKIMKELSNSETSLFYLNGQCNIEKTVFEMYQSLTNG
ncbi:hypothetical protein [Niallia oryzisoli]|uniref:hypothetical protein n=1 Tax=Niallia oryzisoli TaxID=1737571 RepID=UPI003734DA50